MQKSKHYCVTDIFLENEHKELLLIKRSLRKEILPDTYNGLGGKIELGETPLEAIKREVKEEAGITKVKNIRLRANLTVKDKFGFWQIYIFEGKVSKKSIKLKNISEGKLEWIKKKNLTKTKLVPDVKKWILKMYQNYNSFIFAKIEYDYNYNLKKRVLLKIISNNKTI